MNISDKAISKWECGSGNPDVSLILELLSVLGIDVQELLADYEKRQIN
jgi:transcriptional regulator with XRE-family HTH domain